MTVRSLVNAPGYEARLYVPFSSVVEPTKLAAEMKRSAFKLRFDVRFKRDESRDSRYRTIIFITATYQPGSSSDASRIHSSSSSLKRSIVLPEVLA